MNGTRPQVNKEPKGREQQLLTDLRRHLENAEKSLWAAGRIINELKRKYGYLTKDLAHLFPQTANRLDEIAATVRAFPRSLRNKTLTFYAHEVARRAARRTAIGIRKHFGSQIDPPYERSLKLVDQTQHRNGVLAVQELTRTLLEEERIRREPHRRAKVARLSASNAGLLAQMHNEDCRAVMRRTARLSVKLLHVDAPYANYSKTDGVLKRDTSASAFSCDNNSRVSAVDLVCDILRLADAVLVENGVIALWQASSGLPAALAKAIEDCGLIHHPFILWDRGFVQLGDPSMVVQYSSEVCYVLTRRSEQPLGHHAGERGQIIRTERRSRRASDFKETHLMEKPAAVNEELLRRFTSEGDIVLDACGCSASMCIAANRLSRRWIYCETNDENFSLGKRNMEDCLAADQARTA
jgi:DNA methylase